MIDNTKLIITTTKATMLIINEILAVLIAIGNESVTILSAVKAQFLNTKIL